VEAKNKDDVIPKVLVIDDEDDFRGLTVDLLESEGYDVHAAKDGVEGMDLVHKTPFDLVITDIIMPRKEGFEVCQELLALYPDIAIIAMTGASPDYLKQVSYLGVKHTIQKPFEIKKFLSMVRNAIDKNTTYTALAVEDDFASRQYLALLLKKLKIHVLIAETGEAALEMMRDENVDVMLIDIALGAGIDGIELYKRFKIDSRFSETPAIAVTAFARDKGNEIFAAGFDDVLAKPYTPDQLKLSLDKHL